ncbi:MAG TPA: methyltransferase domain-containing protein, partial [Agriterribacter sp.]|nr:methyltransferase domain-containing protein [Agriterribacter sp.]
KKNNITNCRFQCVDIEKDRSALTQQFDRITSFEVIEHLRDENNISIFRDFLKDDGLLAVSVPNKWWIFETHGAKLPLLPWNRVPFFSWLPRSLHERWANARIYTKSRIIDLLERNGFEVINTEYVMAPMDVLKEGRLKRFLVKNFFESDTTKIPFKSTAILVIARKKR